MDTFQTYEKGGTIKHDLHFWLGEETTQDESGTAAFKAVELDDLSKPVDDMVLHTCSAVDIRTVFGQVRTFWNQLAWPDPETAYVFVSRILDDICKASIVYAKKLVSKCSSANRTSNEDLHFNREQCHVVNNLEFVLNAIRYF